ncbi:MAG: hypothetical protein LBD23_12795 [Oscillospiraceae bacterium]|jgi:hypothetical protein|nr:hypothetical protein [Oscillospiraceae bacterium]
MGIIKIKNKITAALNNKSGVSLIFVLGIMMLLMAIATSVLTAASANIGANVRQSNYNRAVVLSDSVHRNIRHSLIDSEPGDEDSLAYGLVMEIYDKWVKDWIVNVPAGEPPRDPPRGNEADVPPERLVLADIELDTVIDVDLDEIPVDDVEVTLEFESLQISGFGPVGAIFEDDEIDDDGVEIPGERIFPRIPRTVNIRNVRMIVTVKVKIVGMSIEDREIRTQATYRYSDGVFSDEESDDFDEDYQGDDYDLDDMELIEYGNWRLVHYETN